MVGWLPRYLAKHSAVFKDVVAFYRAINKNKKTELFILENFIRKGYLIADRMTVGQLDDQIQITVRQRA